MLICQVQIKLVDQSLKLDLLQDKTVAGTKMVAGEKRKVMQVKAEILQRINYNQ